MWVFGRINHLLPPPPPSCADFETSAAVILTGGVTPTAATGVATGLLLRLGVACALPVQLGDVRLTRSYFLSEDGAEIVSSAVDISSSDPVNTATGDCADVGTHAGPTALRYLQRAAARARSLASPPDLHLDLLVRGSCSAPALGSDSALTLRFVQIFNVSGRESASNLDGVPAPLRPFAEAAGNASGTKVESITVRLASFSNPAAAALAASTAPTGLGPVLMGSFAIGAAVLFCCIGGAVLLLLRRNRRLTKGPDISSATGAGMIMSSNPMLTPPHIRRPSSMRAAQSLAMERLRRGLASVTPPVRSRSAVDLTGGEPTVEGATAPSSPAASAHPLALGFAARRSAIKGILVHARAPPSSRCVGVTRCYSTSVPRLTSRVQPSYQHEGSTSSRWR